LWAVIAIDRRVLGRCLAYQFREDLAVEGIGAGWHGSALDLPAGVLQPRRGYEISVRRDGDGKHLPGSPYLLKPAIQIVPGL
jgi:O-antigen biosynthesis protein